MSTSPANTKVRVSNSDQPDQRIPKQRQNRPMDEERDDREEFADCQFADWIYDVTELVLESADDDSWLRLLSSP